MAPKPSAVAVSSESRACCCKWCLESLAVDHPNGESACVSRLLPKISDWKKTVEAKRLEQPVEPRETRSSGPPSVLKSAPAPRGHTQTARTRPQQSEYDRRYHVWYVTEQRRLEKAANDRRRDWLALLEEPLCSERPSGVFSDFEMLKLEFITLLTSKVRPELLVRGEEETLNNSAQQIFAREVKRIEAFSGVAAARLPGEQISNNFALQYLRYTKVVNFREQLELMIKDWRQQMLQRHGNLAVRVCVERTHDALH